MLFEHAACELSGMPCVVAVCEPPPATHPRIRDRRNPPSPEEPIKRIEQAVGHGVEQLDMNLKTGCARALHTESVTAPETAPPFYHSTPDGPRSKPALVRLDFGMTIGDDRRQAGRHARK